MCSAKPRHSNTQQEISFLGRPVGPHNCTVELLSFWKAAFAVSCITFGRDLKGKFKRSEKMIFSITLKTAVFNASKLASAPCRKKKRVPEISAAKTSC